MIRLTLAALIVAALTPLALQPAMADSASTSASTSTRGVADAAPSVAEQALATVESVLRPSTGASARRARTAPTGDATMAFRTLVQHRHELPRAQRQRAGRLLARPSADRVRCSSICVHWSTSGSNRATSTFVNQVLSTMKHVRSTYQKAGYALPLKDGKQGGNAKLDVYLRNIGGQGFYGYCTSDKSASRVPAYCVLDNNFSRSEFPQHTPLQNLQVTAAHEYFHAVQFAYDYAEDPWFMEATAAWAEDELYNNVNDNRQYLPSSQLADPSRSMDQFADSWHYGQWIFFRYLSEQFPATKGSLPSIVLDIWKRAGTRSGEPDDYSIKAVAAVLKARGTTLPAVYAAYVYANRHATTAYSEGAAFPPYLGGATGSPSAVEGEVSPSQAPQSWSGTIDHLASATAVAYPAGSSATTTLSVDLSIDASTPAAIIDPVGPDGATIDDPRFPMVVPLAADGTAQVADIPFDAAVVDHVDVDLVNAGARYTCWRKTRFSCSGKPLDDNAAVSVSFTAID